MANQKKGFVLYFDSLGLLKLLPPNQIGEVVLALYDYAARICNQEEAPEDALFLYPHLEPAAQMGFCSIAGHILRDTRTWKARQSGCQQAALTRHQKPQMSASGQANPVYRETSTAQPEMMREYMDRLRRSRSET